jgi:crossover junction endodeoxyribonuclease RuvC
MLALGIDPGTALCGFGVVADDEKGDLRLVDYGAISTPSHLPLAERLVQVYRGLQEVIARHDLAAVAVEELFFARNVRTALSVGHARGVALLAAAQAGLPVYEYTPRQIKQAIAGYGSAPKAQVQEMVRLVLGLDFVPQPDDAADAVAAAICHVHSARLTEMIAQAQ